MKKKKCNDDKKRRNSGRLADFNDVMCKKNCTYSHLEYSSTYNIQLIL